MATRRQRQVAERIHEDISTLLQRRTRDPRLTAVTVTGVKVSADLKNATVYVSVLGNEEDARQAMQGLESASGFLRRELGRSLTMRVTPELVFRHDRSFEQGLRIDTLLDTISSQSETVPAGEEDTE